MVTIRALLAACSLVLLVTAQEDAALVAKITRLERLVDLQQAALKDKQKKLTNAQSTLRRLQEPVVEPVVEVTASIFGSYTAAHRAYTEIENLQVAADHLWLILCGALVMFMQAGFAMVESGACRAKNVQNILLKNLTDVCVGTLGWLVFGWAIAQAGPHDEAGFRTAAFGTEEFATDGFNTHIPGKGLEPSTKTLNWFFQWAFCSAAATIVSGGVAERVNFPGYCIFSFLMTGFVYPVVVAWTWGYGWIAAMNDVGYMDFAGSGVVHMAGGVAALVGAIIAGPRAGRFEAARADEFDPHSLPLIVLGTMILWFGWYGFNCGSTLKMHTASTGMLAAQVAMNTTIAAATGGLTVFIIRLNRLHKYDIGGFCNGILAGLVSITAGCGNVTCQSAFVIAVLGGMIYEGASNLMKTLKIDDPIDAFAVHGACGAWGTLMCAMLDWGLNTNTYHGWSGFSCVQAEDGSCLEKNARGQGIAANIVEVLAIAIWVAAWSTLIFLPLRLTGFLRATDGVQQQGMDQAKHSPSKAYVMTG